VEEVDNFLDRVEAMLNGERVEPPVRSKDVHDIVFRVKFGGYDEWQVDLHLDRVERQLAEREPDSGHLAPPERMAGGERPGMFPREDRPAERPFERPPMPGGPMPGGPMPGAGVPVAGMPAPGMSRPGPGQPATNYSRFDDPTDRGDASESPYGQTPGYPPPGYRQNTGYGAPPAGGRTYGTPSPAAAPPFGGGPDRPDQPRTDRPDMPRPGQGAGYGPNERGTDRTSDMRVPPGGGPTGPGMGPRDTGPAGPGQGGPSGPGSGLPPRDTGGFGGPGMAPPPRPAAPGGFPGGPGAGPADMTQPAPAVTPMTPEMQRVDQLRRTFQPRRFGSGYDRGAVDNLFEGILATLSGRAGRPVGEADLDPHRFNLVPGGYYEDEVDDALRQARDILRRR
jgi:DivIVA domain-containing protein